MKKVRKVAYFPPSVSKELEKEAEKYTSESAFIVEAVKEKIKRNNKK